MLSFPFIKIPKLLPARDMYHEQDIHQQLWLVFLDYLWKVANTFSQKLLWGQL